MASINSSTSLSNKLGYKKGYKVLLYNQPANYFDLLHDLPPEIELLENIENKEADLIHIFCTSVMELKKITNIYKPALVKNGLIWISWPKSSSKIITDLKRDIIRSHLLKNGLVDVKVASIDEIWSGLKFVYRIKDR